MREGQRYVGRGGEKLKCAVDRLGLDLGGLVGADLGCNIGGFTDCMLQEGVLRVYAVDTGYGMLAWKLRQDERVVVMERTNAMHVELPERVGVVTVDVGWTRQRHILPHALELCAPGGIVLSLFKPQYEAAPELVAPRPHQGRRLRGRALRHAGRAGGDGHRGAGRGAPAAGAQAQEPGGHPARLRGGRMSVIPEVTFRGDHYARGLERGRMLARTLRVPELPGLPPGFVAGCRAAALDLHPAAEAEFEGIVRGGGFDRARMEAYYFARLESRLGGCTMIGIEASRLAEADGPLAARNYDWAVSDLRWCRLERYEPTDAPRAASATPTTGPAARTSSANAGSTSPSRLCRRSRSARPACSGASWWTRSRRAARRWGRPWRPARGCATCGR